MHLATNSDSEMATGAESVVLMKKVGRRVSSLRDTNV